MKIQTVPLVYCVLQVRIARIFNTYGPRMCLDDGRVVSNFVAQVGLLYTSSLLEFELGRKELLLALFV